jgi:hypothetical protein
MALVKSGNARADVFKLKDGSTIVGSVVGYVGNSFKVKTSYGYALVEKDKIVSIQISGTPESNSSKKEAKPDAKKNSATEKRLNQPSKEPAAKADANASAKQISAAKESSATPQTAPPAAPSSTAASTPPSATAAGTPGTPEGTPEASQANVAALAGVPVPNPEASNPAQPEPIREKVIGNTYVNDTYQFQMYKPPDWQVMDGARSVLPGAIAAMGTDDQSTYLVIGQQTAGKSAADDSAAMEKRLGDILVNFRPLPNEHLTVSGEPVVAHRFRGSMDQQDWSGFMVFLPRGGKLFTIFGMTRADNDLVQIQENVIRRAITSFQFLPQ